MARVRPVAWPPGGFRTPLRFSGKCGVLSRRGVARALLLSLSLKLFALSCGAEAVDGGGVTPRFACDTCCVRLVRLQYGFCNTVSPTSRFHAFDCVCLS